MSKQKNLYKNHIREKYITNDLREKYTRPIKGSTRPTKDLREKYTRPIKGSTRPTNDLREKYTNEGKLATNSQKKYETRTNEQYTTPKNANVEIEISAMLVDKKNILHKIRENIDVVDLSKIILSFSIQLFILYYFGMLNLSYASFYYFLKKTKSTAFWYFLKQSGMTLYRRHLVPDKIKSVMKEKNIPPIFYNIIFDFFWYYFRYQNVGVVLLQSGVSAVGYGASEVTEKLLKFASESKGELDMNGKDHIQLTMSSNPFQTTDIVKDLSVNVTQELLLSWTKGEVSDDFMQKLLLNVFKTQYTKAILTNKMDLFSGDDNINDNLKKIIYGYDIVDVKKQSKKQLRVLLQERNINFTDKESKKSMEKKLDSFQKQLNVDKLIDHMSSFLIPFIIQNIADNYQENRLDEKNRQKFEAAQAEISNWLEIQKKGDIVRESKLLEKKEREAWEEVQKWIELSAQKEQTTQTETETAVSQKIQDLKNKGIEIDEKALKEYKSFWPLFDYYGTLASKEALLYSTGSKSLFYGDKLIKLSGNEFLGELSTSMDDFILSQVSEKVNYQLILLNAVEKISSGNNLLDVQKEMIYDSLTSSSNVRYGLKLMFSPDDKFEIIFGDELQNILGKITS